MLVAKVTVDTLTCTSLVKFNAPVPATMLEMIKFITLVDVALVMLPNAMVLDTPAARLIVPPVSTSVLVVMPVAPEPFVMVRPPIQMPVLVTCMV